MKNSIAARDRSASAKKLLELLVRCRRRVLARRRDRAGRVGGGEVQLVEPDQSRLREIERRVIGRRDGDGPVHAIENLIRQTTILAPEDERDRPVGARVKELGRGALSDRSGAASPHDGGP